MAIINLEGHILDALARDPELIVSEEKREMFSERFLNSDFQTQYSLMSWMFTNLQEMEIQPWLMNLANQMIKTASPGYKQSQFQNRSTMVEFFIWQYSYGEMLELRTTIWNLIR